jgi:hypothetical protein
MKTCLFLYSLQKVVMASFSGIIAFVTVISYNGQTIQLLEELRWHYVFSSEPVFHKQTSKFVDISNLPLIKNFWLISAGSNYLFCCIFQAKIFFIPPPRKQSLGGYIGITLSVRPCTL